MKKVMKVFQDFSLFFLLTTGKIRPVKAIYRKKGHGNRF